MSTIIERMDRASASAYEFAVVAIGQAHELLGIRPRPSNIGLIAQDRPALLAALIDAAVKTYAIERRNEAADKIADGLRDIADALKGNTAAISHATAILDTMAPPRFKGKPARFEG